MSYFGFCSPFKLHVRQVFYLEKKKKKKKTFRGWKILFSVTTFCIIPQNLHHSPESTLLNSNPPMRCQHHMACWDWLEGMNDVF